MRKLPLIRRLAAGLFFITFLLLFLFPNSSRAGRLGELWASLQLFPLILRLLATLSLTALLLLLAHTVIALFMGRLYCSFFCPLGVFQDIVLSLSKGVQKRKFSYSRGFKKLHYGLFLVGVVSFVAGSTLFLNITEPYALFSRVIRDLFSPLISLLSIAISSIQKKRGVYTAPFEHSLEPLLFLLTLLSATLLIVAVTKKGRLFCNTLCPTGALLRLVSSVSLFKIEINPERCTKCRACEKGCRTSTIDVSRGRVENDRCVKCFTCLSLCPYEAISVNKQKRLPSLSSLKRPTSLSKRSFLKGSLLSFPLLLSSTLFKKRVLTPDGLPHSPAVPPGAGGVQRFTRYCVSCHLCVSGCPTKVLTPSFSEYGPKSLFQPVMDFSAGFCDYECTRCSSLCPSGAIEPITVDLKKQTSIGEVIFLQPNCIVETSKTACGACAEVCPTGAVYMVPYRENLTIPAIDESLCIGCGSCEFSCPTLPKAIYIEGRDLHKRVDKVKKQSSAETDRLSDETPEEFPF